MAFRAGTTSALYLATAAGAVTNVSVYGDSTSADMSAAQLDVSVFGTQAQAFLTGQTTGKVSLSGPLDAPIHTLLTGLYNAGSRSSFIYGPGGSVAGEVRLAGSLNVESINYSSSASGRVEFSASLQITGAISASTF
jgi:hypothetical protein